MAIPLIPVAVGAGIAGLGYLLFHKKDDSRPKAVIPDVPTDHKPAEKLVQKTGGGGVVLAPVAPPKPFYTNAVSGADLRATSSISGVMIRTLPYGTIVDGSSVQNGFTKIKERSTGAEGWISTPLLTPYSGIVPPKPSVSPVPPKPGPAPVPPKPAPTPIQPKPAPVPIPPPAPVPPPAPIALGKWMVIATPGANLRSAPNAQSNILTGMPKGTRVTQVPGVFAGWYKVRVDDLQSPSVGTELKKGIEGYVASDLVGPYQDYISPDQSPPPSTNATGITTAGVNLRATPSTSGTIVEGVAKGTNVIVLKKADGTSDIAPPTAGAPQGWYHVSIPNGKTGYISAEYILIGSGKTLTRTEEEERRYNEQRAERERAVIQGEPILDVPGGSIFGAEAEIRTTAIRHPESVGSFREWIRVKSPVREQAITLYKTLREKGTAPSSVVAAFQKATNGDNIARTLHGTLRTDGVYDLATSAALTLYSGKPILHDPTAAPREKSLGSLLTSKAPSNAVLSGFNLTMYLKKKPYNPADPVAKEFVLQFQRDVNTDPKFPGPAFMAGNSKKVVKERLAENGIYNTATRAAHGIVS